MAWRGHVPRVKRTIIDVGFLSQRYQDQGFGALDPTQDEDGDYREWS
jgi:hypothetical protein